jgi:hypothetical protein
MLNARLSQDDPEQKSQIKTVRTSDTDTSLRTRSRARHYIVQTMGKGHIG